MQLEGYELLELAMEGGVQVSKLREQKSGNLFQLHAFHGEMLGKFQEVCRELPSIPPQISRVVKVSQDRGTGYILTELLPEDVGIQTWIGRLREVPLTPVQNPSLSRASVENLRKLEMDPGALQPILPGPEKRAPAPAAPADSESADPMTARVYRVASQLKNAAQGATAADAEEAGSPASRPAEPPPEPPPPQPPKVETDSRTPSELTRLINLRKIGKGPAARPEPAPAPTPERRTPEPPPKLMPEVRTLDVPLPTERSTAADHESGLDEWIRRPAKVPDGVSPPAYRPPLLPDREASLPMPPVPTPSRVDLRQDPLPTPSPRHSYVPPVPPSLVDQRPAIILPPPRPKPEESVWPAGTDWRFIAWTVGGLVVALVVVLWIVEKAG